MASASPPTFRTSSIEGATSSAGSSPIDPRVELIIPRMKRIIAEQLEFRKFKGAFSINWASPPPDITSPTEYSCISDPIIAKCCQHVLDNNELKQWISSKPDPNCPHCGSKLKETTSIPRHALHAIVKEKLPKESVLICFDFKDPDSAKYLEAQYRYIEDIRACIMGHVSEGNKSLEKYIPVLNHYKRVLELKGGSSDFYTISTAIPELYDALDEPEKASLCRLSFSLHKFQKEEIQEGTEILKSCATKIMDLRLLELALTSIQSQSKFEEVMAYIKDKGNPLSEKIFLCRQILRITPWNFSLWDAYEQLIPLTENLREKMELLLEGAQMACDILPDLAQRFNEQLQQILNPKKMSTSIWAGAQTALLPPYPAELATFLSEPCPFWPGKTRRETHIVAPVFSKVELDGSTVPLTLKTLDQLDKRANGPGLRYENYENIPENLSADRDFHYAVMTNDIIPGSRGKPLQQQIEKLAEKGYELPSVVDAASAILWEKQSTGKSYFANDCWKYTRCKEQHEGVSMILGQFKLSGLHITPDPGFALLTNQIGAAGMRKFKVEI